MNVGTAPASPRVSGTDPASPHEGQLRILDENGQPTRTASEIRQIYFNAYTWGAEPASGDSYNFKSEVRKPKTYVRDFNKSGVESKSWKSNYYGYVEII